MTNSRDHEESEAMRHYYREELHHLPRGIHYPIARWVAEECHSQGMTRDGFASHCLESLKVDRKDAEGTCPECGAHFDMSDESWEIWDGHQIHYCGATS